jgi:hypothetical protein
MTKLLTPQQAADQAHCGRSSIMRALMSQELHGVRDNKGVWRIAPEELARWMASRPVTNQQAPDHGPATNQSGVMVSVLDTLVSSQPEPSEGLEIMRGQRDEARLEAVLARAEAGQLRERLDETRRERDHWRQMAERLSEPKPSMSPPKPPASFLARLFGRS